MPDIIQLLPDAIANQIAAGEVVQRPASVVKELMENAVDAGADEIEVIVRDAGKALIQVIDNGSGMTETDARMSLERHATSKIRKTDDLFCIRTMGFRGEALASIAAVSQLELKTRVPDSEIGTLVEVEASEVKSQKPDVPPQGTSVAVKNLFYNVPARRNFLKSNAAEMRHVTEEFLRVALSYPEIRFILYHNDLESYNLPPGKLSQRIVHVFGKSYQQQLVPIQENTPHVTLHGYIGTPQFAKKTRGEQYFFVNHRYIRSNYLHHAVMNAYEGLIAEGSYPFYVIFMELDPAHVDVNVHPAKYEVKFDDERTLYGVVKAAVKQALGSHHISPSIDFDLDINLPNKLQQVSLENLQRKQEKDYGNFRSLKGKPSDASGWEALYTEHDLDFDKLMERPDAESESTELRFDSALNAPKEPEAGELASGKVFHLFHAYLVTQVKSGLLLIKQQAAWERILYEKFMRQIQTHAGASQQCLFPATLELAPGDFELVEGMKEEIQALGFEFETFGKNALIIRGVPADLAQGPVDRLFEGIIEQFKQNREQLGIDQRENLARAAARRAAASFEKSNNEEEMSSLIGQLFACQNPNYTPGGQKTFIIFDREYIQNLFN